MNLVFALLLAMVILLALVIRDLFRGVTTFGGWKITRADNAKRYWVVLAFYIFAIGFMFLVAVQLAGETIGCDVWNGHPCTVTIRVSK